MRALAWCALFALAAGLDSSCDCNRPPSEPNPSEKCRCSKLRRTVRSLGYGPLNRHVPEFRHGMSTTPVPFPPAADILGVYYLPDEEYRSNEQRSYVIKPKIHVDYNQPKNTYPDSVVSPSEVHFRDVQNHKDYFLDNIQPKFTYITSYPTSTITQPPINNDNFRYRQSPKNYFLDQVQPEYMFSASYLATGQPNLRNGEFGDALNQKDYLLYQTQPKYTYSVPHSNVVTGKPVQIKGEFRDDKNPKDYFLDRLQPENTLGSPYSTAVIAQPSLRNGEFRDAKNQIDDFLDQVQPGHTFSSSYPNSISAQPILSTEKITGSRNPKRNSNLYNNALLQSHPSKSALSNGQTPEDYIIPQTQPQFITADPVIVQSGPSHANTRKNQNHLLNLFSQIQTGNMIPYHGADPVIVQSGPSQALFREDQNQKNYFFDTMQPQYIIPHDSFDPFTFQPVSSQVQFKENRNNENRVFENKIPEYIIPYPGAEPVMDQSGPRHAQFRDDHKQQNYFVDQTQLRHEIPYSGIYPAPAQTGINEGKSYTSPIQNKKKSYSEYKPPAYITPYYPADIISHSGVNSDLIQFTLSQHQFEDDQNSKAKTLNKNYVPYRTFSENPDFFLDQIQLKDTYRKVNSGTLTNVSIPNPGRREFRDSLDNTRVYLDVSFDGEPPESRASESDIEAVQNAMMNCMDLQLFLLMNTSTGDEVDKSFWNRAHTHGIVNEHQLQRQIQLKCHDPEKTFEDIVQGIIKSKINKTNYTQNKHLNVNEKYSQNLTSRTIDGAEKSNNSKSETESELGEFSSNETKKVKHFIDYENQSTRSGDYEDDDNSKYYEEVTEIVLNSSVSDQTTERSSIEPTFDMTLTPLARRKRTRREVDELSDATSNETSSELSEKTSSGNEVRAYDSLPELSRNFSDENKSSTAPRGKRPMYKQSELKIPTVEIRELATGEIVVRKGIEKLPNSDVFPSEVDAKNTIPAAITKTKGENESTVIANVPIKVRETIGNKHVTNTVALARLNIIKLNKDESRTLIGKFPLIIVEGDNNEKEYSKEEGENNEALLGNDDKGKLRKTRMIYGNMMFAGGETDKIALRATQLQNGTLEFDVVEKDRRGLCGRLASRIKKKSAFMYALCIAVNANKTV